MPKYSFTTADELAARIDAYFDYIKGDESGNNLTEYKTPVHLKQEARVRQPEPATFTGLAIFLGFNSKQAFEKYETRGRFANALKQGRLRIEAAYEKKLHLQSATGAIFALKSMGWNEKDESKTSSNPSLKSLKIEILETGPRPAENEKEVTIT